MSHENPYHLAEGEPDPATPERRLELARALLVWAIQGYEQAQHQWSVIREAYPKLLTPRWPHGLEEYREHKAWMRLFDEADDAFNSAELCLAQRIENLHDALAAPGRRASDDDGPYFVPRAVRHHGTVYVLAYGVGEYEPKTNIVAVYREALTVDLDGPPGTIGVDVM